MCHAGLRSGELDAYVEYTGTALLNVLRLPVEPNPERAFRTVAAEYRDRFDLEWLPPIGFNDTYAITVRQADSAANGWTTIADLAPLAADLTAGFTAEFMERPDGYPGLKDAYGFQFGTALDLDPGLMYQALADGQVDLICAFATDGRIAEYDLKTLDDNLRFFPPYDAAPVFRADLLARHPEIRDALAPLAGAISDADMRAMNHAVDVDHREPAAVAADWIRDHLGADEEPPGAPRAKPANRAGFFALALRRRAEVLRKTLRHLALTAMGTSIAVCIGLPLGILIHRRAAARGPVLAAAEIVQTIPSLAMLAFLFALYGLLGAPASGRPPS
ncbi:MAG: hypothetical protein IPJ41_12115 [Phycisphaerales bacterium]|nr:hypothetical protein [Phycisphaerales bacterium]